MSQEKIDDESKETSRKRTTEEVKKASTEFEPVSTARYTTHSIEYTVKDKNGRIHGLKKLQHYSADMSKAAGIINMHELHIMGSIKHPYIETASAVYFEDPCPVHDRLIGRNIAFDRVFFLTPKADFSCHELVHHHNASISHVKRAMFQIATAVQYLHSIGMIHRNLKPSNFACHYAGGILTAKLTDFSTAKMIGETNYSGHYGTRPYRAPELFSKNIENRASIDIWALACSFGEMVSGPPLFRQFTDDSAYLGSIFEERGSPDEETAIRLDLEFKWVNFGNHTPRPIRKSLKLKQRDAMLFDAPMVDNLANPGSLDDFCDMLDKMLALHPEKRLSINQVLGHPFFSGVRSDDPKQYGIWMPKTSRIETELVLEKSPPIVQHFPTRHDLWEIGANILNEIQLDTAKYDRRTIYLIKFHALDIYSRFLLTIRPTDNKGLYIAFAWCSAYIASKYFLQEDSDHLWFLFPDAEMDMSIEAIVKFERVILQALRFVIFRPTCFTHFNRPELSASLFSLMLRRDVLYEKPIEEIMEKFNSTCPIQSALRV